VVAGSKRAALEPRGNAVGLHEQNILRSNLDRTNHHIGVIDVGAGRKQGAQVVQALANIAPEVARRVDAGEASAQMTAMITPC